MKNIYIFLFSIIIIFNISQIKADETSDWLKQEIDKILISYQNEDLPNENRFLMIEQTINNNFAGAGIGKFVAGQSWSNANKETKKKYIKNFKRHLALNIASMMQGYSGQEYKIFESKIDSKNKVTLVDMEIYSETSSLIVTWRVKKSKDRFFVIDLIVADISLVVTKRSEFNSMLKTVDYNLEDFNQILLDQNEKSYQKIIN